MTKKKKSSTRLLTADQIVALIVDTITDTIDDSGKSLSAHALDEWKVSLLKSVKANLAAGGKWTPLAQKNVLKVAEAMATIAIIVSDDDAEVNKARITGAFKAAKTHKACPGAGSGAWCDF